MNDKPNDAQIAFMELKGKIVKLMFEFTDKYSDTNSGLYPQCSKILVDVLTACLSEAQYQVCNYQPFTRKQIDHICSQIGDWYLMIKPFLEGPHNLSYMKEELKTIICD